MPQSRRKSWCLGAKVGRNVFWDTYIPFETAGYDVGDNVVVDAGAMIVGHTVDGGVMRHAPTIIVLVASLPLEQSCNLGSKLGMEWPLAHLHWRHEAKRFQMNPRGKGHRHLE